MGYVLDIDHVGKRYVTYRSSLQRFATWFGARIAPASEYWANRDISFQVRAGQAMALIGQNGAGKSTLLKMITGTVRPTTGQVRAQGRIHALLELGLGFNPEFTGRQNVHHAGGLMGYSTAELNDLMPQIEDFAEIGDFFDKPLRVYSSGMQARLAFALATARQPDVLIVDEILSVGDSYFQHKSFARIRQFKENGAAILLVTHSLSDVRALCDRVILLDQGRVLKDGAPDEIVDYYNAMIAERENARGIIQQNRGQDGWLKTRSGTFEARIHDVALHDAQGAVLNTVMVGQQARFTIEIHINAPIPRLVVGLMLRDRTGATIWGSNTWHSDQVLTELQPGEIIRLSRDFTCHLGPGSYALTLSLSSSDTHLDDNYEWLDNSVVFDVINADKPVFIGTQWLDGQFTFDKK